MASRVWVVGSANVDLVMLAPRFPNPGETVLGGRFSEHPGGKGANQAVAAARLGARTTFVGAIGSDAYGDRVLEAVCEAEVNVSHIARLDDAPTGIGLIVVDASGQNEIVVASGANARLSEDRVRDALRDVQDSDVVLTQLETTEGAVVAASERGTFILNPAPASTLPESVLARSFAVTPNQHETLEFTGVWPDDIPSCERAAAWFLDRGAQNVVVTLGAGGACWVSAQGAKHFPARAVEAVDATAAGDAFSGALACFYGETQDLGRSIEFANRAAGIAVTRLGAIPSLAYRSEFEL